MIIRNAYTGTLQEVPDHQLYEVGEPVYDGFGNPVGSIFDDIAKGVGSLVSAPVQAATSLINPIRQVAGGLLGPIAQMAGNIPGMISSAAGNLFNPIAGAASNFANTLMPGGYMRPPVTPYMRYGMPPTSMPAPYHPQFRPPWPMGWMRPNLPYTGLGPQRMYMRCAVWPGAAGLVPQPGLIAPPPGTPGAPGVPGAGGYGGGRRRHRRHRR